MKVFSRILGVVLFIGVVAFIYYSYTVGEFGRFGPPKTLYDEIMSRNIEESYPQTPNDVIALHNKILRYYYGGDTANQKESKLEDVLKVQRKLLASRLLEHNPEEVHFSHLKDEVQQYSVLQRVLVDAKQEYAQFDPKKPNEAYVRVIQFFNRNNNVYLQYTLVKENEQWKILGWKYTETFEILSSSLEKDNYGYSFLN